MVRAGPERLKRSPFAQASESRHALVRKLCGLPTWRSGRRPINGHGVAFPGVDLDSMRGRLGLDVLGPDADPELIADQSMFVDGDEGRRELGAFVDRAFSHWHDAAGTYPPGRDGIDLLLATLVEPFEIRSMLRHEIAGGEADVVRLTEGQYQTLHMLRGVRRAAIVGGAGTGKTMLAAEKARRLAREGFSTLLICFNAPLARMLAEETADVAAETGQLTVATFHQLCQDLGREAGVLGERPDPVPQQWWDETLPNALVEAADRLGPRYHAIVVDEGQDFAPDWLLALEALSFGGRDDVLYVFHDPAQAIFREDVVEQLGLTGVLARTELPERAVDPRRRRALRAGRPRVDGPARRRPGARVHRGGRGGGHARGAAQGPASIARRGGRAAVAHRRADRGAARGIGRVAAAPVRQRGAR